MPAPLTALLDDLRAEQADLRARVADADLDAPTPARGWDVRDAVAHLAGTDVEALKAATRPADFLAGLAGVAEELSDAGSQSAARVGQVREAAAQRVDRAVDEAARQAPEYNPVRILGNAAQIAVKSAFSLVGAIVSVGGQAVDYTTRKVSGRG